MSKQPGQRRGHAAPGLIGDLAEGHLLATRRGDDWIDLIPRRWAAALLPVFGVLALATPLVMWMAWEPEILGYGMTIGVGSLLVAAILGARLAPRDVPPAADEAWRRAYEDFVPPGPDRSLKRDWRDRA